MPGIARVVTRWTGFNGAPGFTNLFFRDFEGGDGQPNQASIEGAQARVQTFWNAVNDYLPNDVTLTIDSVVDILDSTNGQLINSLNAPSSPVITGLDASSYAAASGAVISWRTATIRNGRRIRGRTFLVPMGSGAFGVNGGIQPSIVTALQNAANALLASSGTPDLHIWARPTGPGATDGVLGLVTGASVPTVGAVLRSRRD
jgi:hypothetical protein